MADLYHVQPLIGAGATELAVRDEIDHGPRVIHLATHGYLQDDAPLASCVALADGESLSVDELMGLDLKADIVVLSACDTGRGKLQGSELIGLARGLLYAGARAVIVSLWPVDDIPTTILMQLLHHIKLHTDKPFAQVLWQAGHQLRQITAPKLHRFCAVAAKLVGTDPLEQAEFLRYLSDELAAYKDFAQAAEYCKQAIDILNTAGYYEQAKELTRLGNIYRAAELYPYRRYGLDSVVFWPRLRQVLPDGFVARMQELKIAIDFLLLFSLLAVLFSLLAVPYLLWHRVELWMILVCAAGLPLGWLTYRATLTPALAYAELIKVAYDLYRRPLLKTPDLSPPSSLDQEKALWEALSQFIITGLLPEEQWQYASKPSAKSE